jgi:hypothetical protein
MSEMTPDVCSVANGMILTITAPMPPNGAADKPRKARKPQALTADVGLIRVVVRRGAPSNHADAYLPPRCRGREVEGTKKRSLLASPGSTC